ncbi:hypothetical protein EYF80_061109 [Liparis tanakae]|uniref:Uncharacterized protein n=1 Tax=Liparis tanakae TaxID=230148 RepID=A0A4Z2EJX8_9TELE|nr:hypothetical protein EYF80_061109 [Liparis tanakae]
MSAYQENSLAEPLRLLDWSRLWITTTLQRDASKRPPAQWGATLAHFTDPPFRSSRSLFCFKRVTRRLTPDLSAAGNKERERDTRRATKRESHKDGGTHNRNIRAAETMKRPPLPVRGRSRGWI